MTIALRVTTATPDEHSAKRLARSAVAAYLAGNAQIVGPVVSVFRHLGEPGEGVEWQLILSTSRERYPALAAHLAQHHPWRNPEITATELVEASEGYLRWIADATTPVD